MSAVPEYTRRSYVNKHVVAHPLCPLTASEITITADLIRSAWPAHVDLHFKTITLEEPAKKQLAPFIDAEHNGGELAAIDRRAFVAYYIRNTVSQTPGNCPPQAERRPGPLP
jgi:Cu2+-containing amine oxidase